MREARLLERIFQKGINPVAKTTYETGKLVDSVISHLQCLLNTREGCTMIDPELGMADISEIVAEYPDTLGYIRQTIKKIIAVYEPRIENVNVEFVEKNDSDYTLLFNISGVLIRDNRVTPIMLESKFNPEGHIQVKR